MAETAGVNTDIEELHVTGSKFKVPSSKFQVQSSKFKGLAFGLVRGRRIDHGYAVSTAHDAGVIAFYDAHPINEHEILRKVEGTGADLSKLTENDLKAFD